jgi:hypothetical protein
MVGSPFVMTFLIILGVAAPIEFDGQLVFRAVEVNDVSTEGVLSTKSRSKQLLASQTPP